MQKNPLDRYEEVVTDALSFCSAKLRKTFKTAFIQMMILFMVLPRKINFTQMGRCSDSCEQRFRWLTSFGSWNSPDKLSESFYWLSPFSYCGGDPINYIDPDGLAWHLVDDGSDATPAFVWVDDKLAYDKDGNLKEKYYIQGIIFSPTDKEVVYSRNRTDYNIGTSIATVYKADGFTADFNACTVPSDTNKFATIPAGIYEAKVGLHKSNYKALRLGDVGTIDFYANSIELGTPNPSNPKTTKASGINIHKSGKNNYTGVIGENRGVSEGCILIDRNKWNDFISIFEIQKQEGNIVGIILIR